MCHLYGTAVLFVNYRNLLKNGLKAPAMQQLLQEEGMEASERGVMKFLKTYSNKYLYNLTTLSYKMFERGSEKLNIILQFKLHPRIGASHFCKSVSFYGVR